eukprot:109035_1
MPAHRPSTPVGDAFPPRPEPHSRYTSCPATKTAFPAACRESAIAQAYATTSHAGSAPESTNRGSPPAPASSFPAHVPGLWSVAPGGAQNYGYGAVGGRFHQIPVK